MSALELVTLAAASWYVAYVVTSTSGPFGVFTRVREWRGGRWHGRIIDRNAKTTGDYDKYHGLLDCIICTSFWVAQGLTLVTHHSFIDGLAIAGVALMLHRYTGWFAANLGDK